MYILFEMSNSRGGTELYNWDAMGYTIDEKLALMWVQQNPNYRCYKYCPDKQII